MFFFKKLNTPFKALVVLLLLLIPFWVSASLNLEYPVFRGLTLDSVKDFGISRLITYLYYGAIMIATAAAFGVITWGGIEYLTSAGNPSKMSSAIGKIQNSIIGLLIILLSYLFLFTINPSLLLSEDPTLPELGVGDPAIFPPWPYFPFNGEAGNGSGGPTYPGGDPADWISKDQPIPCGWPVMGEISSGYGCRCTWWRTGCGYLKGSPTCCSCLGSGCPDDCPGTGNCCNWHYGIDFGAGCGTPIYATAMGKVVHKGWHGSYGHLIVIEHEDEYSTAYAHLSAYAVNYGQEVEGGQHIGFVGTTGESTGCHLHYEVRKGGGQINPTSYLIPCI